MAASRAPALAWPLPTSLDDAFMPHATLCGLSKRFSVSTVVTNDSSLGQSGGFAARLAQRNERGASYAN